MSRVILRFALHRTNPLKGPFPRHGHALSTKSQVIQDDNRKASESIPDDPSYFKRLGKSLNRFWTENAEEVLRRLDVHKLVDLQRDEEVRENLTRRYCDDKVNLKQIRELWGQWESAGNEERKRDVAKRLVELVLWVPNDTHPSSMGVEGDTPLPIHVHGQKGPKEHEVMEFQKYCEKHNLLRNDNLGNIAYHRSYFLKGPLAELEEGLVRYALDAVNKEGFQLISVPDVIYPHVIESCGMKTRSDRDQVFWVEIPDSMESELCLSGTSEMSIGGSLQNRVFVLSELPLKLAAVSRCFRAETSSIEEERGLYRVHEFTKVELFGITAAETGEESNQLHQDIRLLEESLYSKLGLHFKTLEMPPSELGLPATRKFDIEAWMPGRKVYGEISSCSNCTDYQSRRLNIRYISGKELRFVHTVNGTAMAIPRMLIALVETSQKADGTVKLPSILDKYLTRSWNESFNNHPHYKTTFLRTKGSQMKYTRHFRNMELDV